MEQFEVAFTAHSGSTEKILNYEYRNFWIDGNHQRSLNSSFGVDQMITVLPKKGESIPLKGATSTL